MEKRTYPQLDETVFWEKLPNGLTVAVVQRPDFQRKLCYFAADFGSIHRKFTLDGQKITVPEGIAHYLEHKMFDMPSYDVSAAFSALGAMPNAFTSYDMTAYHFSCTENFEACLRLLLEYVSTPYFTDETVQKEQGIIGQEIGMNEDTPENRVFEQLMQAMYREHPIQEPILGRRETIARITPENLTQCHRAFYRPENMLLCVVGDVDPQMVCDLAQAVLPRNDAQVESARVWQEDLSCDTHFVSANMDVSMPMFQLGFKCPPLGKGEQAVKMELLGDLAAEALFGESSELYLQLYQQGIIDSSFSGGFETVEGMALLTAAGDSECPETVRDAILDRAKALLETGIDEEEFLRMKRSAMGRRIRGLDSFDSTAFRLCAYYFSGFDYFCFPAVYQQVQRQEVLEFIKQTVKPEGACLSVIYPCQQKEENVC